MIIAAIIKMDPREKLTVIIRKMISGNDQVVDILREYLKDIAVEKYKCKAIFRYIISKLVTEELYTGPSQAIILRLDTYIDGQTFKSVSESNWKIYSDILSALEHELKISRATLVILLKTTTNENVYDEITSRIKEYLGISETRKTVRVRAVAAPTAKNNGARLVAAPGKDLTNTEEINNLANIQKPERIVEHDKILETIIAIYNNLHPSRMIGSETIKKAAELWASVYSGITSSKKHIEYYIAYSLKLVDPKIKQSELDATLETMNQQKKANQVSINNVRRFYVGFFNQADPRFDEYRIQNELNRTGFKYSSDRIVDLLRNYVPENKESPVPEHIIAVIEQIETIDGLITFLEKNGLLKVYKKIGSNEKVKLTKVKVNEMSKFIIE